jgi:uncharacterized protein (TIGR00369 family)
MSVSRTIGRQVPFADLLGVEVEHTEPGLARLALAVRPELCNSFGAAHGGVITTLADVALALAAITAERAAHGAQTVDLTLSFIGPGKGRLRAEGRCLRSGLSLAFCEGEVRDAEGALVAKAVGTFRVRRGPGGDAALAGER